jgi:hypothetical protein
MAISTSTMKVAHRENHIEGKPLQATKVLIGALLLNNHEFAILYLF